MYDEAYARLTVRYAPIKQHHFPADVEALTYGRDQRHSYNIKDVCVMAFLEPHDLSRRVFQSAAISAGGLALSDFVMRLLGFVCLR